MVSFTIVGCLVSYTDRKPLGASTDANASPFVIAVNNVNMEIVPSIMNVIILTAVLSVGNSSIYGSSRTIAALADRGQAPKIFGYIDRSGRSLIAILFSSASGSISYIVAAGSETSDKAFAWMMAIPGLSAIFSWGSICLCYIHFRQAWKYRGHTLDELAFRSQATVWGSCLPNSAPCYIVFKAVKKTRFKRIHEIDVTSSRREMDSTAILAEEGAQQAPWPKWKKVLNILCRREGATLITKTDPPISCETPCGFLVSNHHIESYLCWTQAFWIGL